MTLRDRNGRVIQQPDIHNPTDVSPDDQLLLAQMVTEMRQFAADQQLMTLAISPLVAVQLAGLIQLALRHDGTAGDIRKAAHLFLDEVRDFFVDAPAITEVLRRGDLP